MKKNPTGIMKKILLILLGIIILIFIGFYIWGEMIVPVMEEAQLTMESTEEYRFDDEGYLHYQPTKNPLQKGIIIYPGGRVDAAAYGVLGAQLAEVGYDVYIPSFFADLAVFNPNVADKIIEENEAIAQWYMSGHSLGGVMAANYALNQPEIIDGLILLASYPAESMDLSETDIKVLSIYGELDGLSTLDKVNDAKKLLPEETVYHMIEGGNHAYFGYYGPQSGDNEATITREAQQKEIVEVIDDWLNQ